MASPVSFADFQEATIMPTASVQALEADRPGFVAKRLDFRWDQICSKLRKRYDVEAMTADPPETAQEWLVAMVTKDAYDARGYDPSAKSDEEAIKGNFERAKTELQEAADGEKGLTEFPLLTASPNTEGVTKGAPLGYSEASPYVWADDQRELGKAEDDSRR